MWPFSCAMSFIFSCFTTEIFEGFDVIRTSGYTDTMRTYGYLTLSIIDYYSTNFQSLAKSACICPTYDEFERQCRCLQKKTVSQIFALQLMQVTCQYKPSLQKLASCFMWCHSWIWDIILIEYTCNAMQVPQVTDKVALTIIEFYPTLFSLARAYSMLVSLLLVLIFILLFKLQHLLIVITLVHWHFCELKFYLYDFEGRWCPCPRGDVEEQEQDDKCRG
jgi:hypothetical protein